MFGIVLTVLRKGAVLVIDELGNSIHPLLLAEIVRIFKDKRYNTSDAQLILTTHNTDIMEQDMMRVSDFNGARNVTNFQKQYLKGIFSGIHYPYI